MGQNPHTGWIDEGVDRITSLHHAAEVGVPFDDDGVEGRFQRVVIEQRHFKSEIGSRRVECGPGHRRIGHRQCVVGLRHHNVLGGFLCFLDGRNTLLQEFLLTLIGILLLGQHGGLPVNRRRGSCEHGLGCLNTSLRLHHAGLLFGGFQPRQHIAALDGAAMISRQLDQCCAKLKADVGRDLGFNRAKAENLNLKIAFHRRDLNRERALVEHVQCRRKLPLQRRKSTGRGNPGV